MFSSATLGDGPRASGEEKLSSSSSLVEGPRISADESLSDPDDSSEDDKSEHFRLWRAIGRGGVRVESSENVELMGGGLPGGEFAEKFRCGTEMLETSGVSAGLRQRVALTRTGRFGCKIGVVQIGFRRSWYSWARSIWQRMFCLIFTWSTRAEF